MGLLITVEGGEYTGKTSVVVPGLARYFEKKGIPVLVSREPGGTVEAEKMRKVIFEKMRTGAPQEELAELFMKARQIHLKERIIPFLGEHKQKNVVMILDRYLDSTRVYQGLEGGVSLEKIRQLERKYIDNYYPDLTLILFFPQEKFEATLKARMNDQRETTAWDNHTINRHQKRQDHYLTLPALSKKWGENRHFVLIDASQSPEVVVAKAIEARLPLVMNHFDI